MAQISSICKVVVVSILLLKSYSSTSFYHGTTEQAERKTTGNYSLRISMAFNLPFTRNYRDHKETRENYSILAEN